jgi:hypothetical protein
MFGRGACAKLSASVWGGAVRSGFGAWALALLVGCSSKGARSDGGGSGSSGVDPAGPSCSDLFQPDHVRTYSIDISPDEWTRIQAEFHDVASLMSQGNDFVTRHPVVFHMGSETVSDATLKLHGQSSWAQTVMFDGAREKMQFDISFHQTDPNGKFHGVEKLVFDMPRSDWTFMHDRIAHAWLRQVGIAAGCAANARVEINGAYYGLFVAEETTNKRVIKEFFPDNSTGDLWKAGIQPETNQNAPDYGRQQAYTHATTDIASLSAIIDLEASVGEWAGEALINEGDGMYGGNHNFYIYDQGAKGFVYLPNDTDATFDWLTNFDLTPVDEHPIYWWEGRAAPASAPRPEWMVTMADPAWRAKYVDAIQGALGRWDVAQIQGWIHDWSQQIASDVAADPHTWATTAQFQGAVATASDVIAKRAQFLQSFVDCEKNAAGAASDGDSDGYPWCNDCRDDAPTVHPGAPEICGNQIDDDCNGIIDDGCSAGH